MILRRFTFILLVFGLCPMMARALNATQNPQEVTRAVKQAAQNLAPAGAQVSVGAVSGAAFMPACPSPLAVSIGGVAPYEQATVQCSAPRWTLYIQVTIEQSEDVVVAAKPLTAGQTITADDLMVRRIPVQNFAGRQIFTDPTQLTGDQMMMSLPAGGMLTQNIIQSPLVVKAGQMVTVHVYSGTVMLSMDAIADQDGRIGDTILLTNPSSGRRFSAEVTAQGIDLHL